MQRTQLLLRGAALAAALVVAAPRASAGTYVVDAAGGGDFTDLQTALDTVPEGSELIVKGDWYDQRIWIEKSITIFGMRLFTHDGYGVAEDDDAILEIDAGADSKVFLNACYVKLGDAADFNGTIGIRVREVGQLVLTSCEVRAGSVLVEPCYWFERHGDGIVIDRADSVEMWWTTTQGGGPGNQLVFDPSCSLEHLNGPRGGYGLRVADGVGAIYLADCQIDSGPGGDVLFVGDGTTVPPDGIVGGDGGIGLYNPNGTNLLVDSTWCYSKGPGLGYTEGCEPPVSNWGEQGQEMVGVRTKIPDRLWVTYGSLGETMTLTGTAFEPDHLALVFLALDVIPPHTIKLGQWMLAPPFVVLFPMVTDATGRFDVSADVPNDPTLRGITFFMQATDLKVLSDVELYQAW